jgi:pimeloyl-ACP methyl ester carboxylesterase
VRPGLLLLLLSSLLLAAPAAGAAELRPVYDFTKAVARYGTPDRSPTGANDWTCRPTAAHPRPVVLVHGTGANMAMSWEALSPELVNRGYCVFALNYGRQGNLPARGLAPVARAARELAPFVDRVLAATGAAQVDLVGHSQGGMMPRQYLRFEGGAPKVGTLIGLAPSNHGVGEPAPPGKEAQAAFGRWLSGLFIGGFCGACVDQTAGSAFMRRLNAGRDTEPGPQYVVITTRYDQIVRPWTSALLAGPNATNIVVQDGCPQNRIDHAAIAYDRRAIGFALHALDPAEPVAVPCTRPRPGVGG